MNGLNAETLKNRNAERRGLPRLRRADFQLPIGDATDGNANIEPQRESIAGGGVVKGKKPGTRKCIRNRLPAATLRALREKLVAAASVTTELTKALDQEFGLRDKYNVAEPYHFLVREREAAEEEQFLSKLKGVRRRQLRAGRVLKKTYGKPGESNLQLWENGAYLKLVEMIYVRLMDDKSELPTAELMALSKAMAEHRRVSVREPGATGPVAVGAGGELPEDFGEAVKQIYGTNFHAVETLKAETQKAETM
jgi:hypothetical protein